MKRKRHTAEEIAKKLREAAGHIAAGKTAEEAIPLFSFLIHPIKDLKMESGSVLR